MRTIWKYMIDPISLEIDMPQGAYILCAKEQHDEIFIWAEVDPNAIKERRFFEVFGTGHNIDTSVVGGRLYIGTAMLNGGNLVFHIYERKVKK